MKVAAPIKNEGSNKALEHSCDAEMVSLDSLSQMTGFPVDFIKSELLVGGTEISMDELRKTMATYLETTIKEVV